LKQKVIILVAQRQFPSLNDDEVIKSDTMYCHVAATTSKEKLLWNRLRLHWEIQGFIEMGSAISGYSEAQ